MPFFVFVFVLGHNILQQQVRLVGPAAADCRLQLQESAGGSSPSAARQLHVAVSNPLKDIIIVNLFLDALASLAFKLSVSE